MKKKKSNAEDMEKKVKTSMTITRKSKSNSKRTMRGGLLPPLSPVEMSADD